MEETGQKLTEKPVFNYQEWHSNALKRLSEEYPKHMLEDFYHGIDADLGFVYWPRKLGGFLDDASLIKMGKILQEINQPIYDDYNQSQMRWIEQNTNEGGFRVEH